MTDNQSKQTATREMTKDLGDGLWLRWSTAADKEGIAHLLGTTFRDSSDEPFNGSMADWISVCSRDDFPFSGPEDWAIVEDRSKPDCPIVACTCFWSHQWSYSGIPIGVGRPEFVGTDPAYRNRGLIRAIFGMLHERSNAKGHLMQGITGIPYFYRLFGYEYALDLGGQRSVQVSQIPEKINDEPDPFALRLATLDDVPTLMELYDAGHSDSLVWHEAPETYWQLLINLWDDPTRSKQDPMDVCLKYRPHMIVDADGNACGFTLIPVRRMGKALTLRYLCLSPRVNVVQLAPCLLHTIKEIGSQLPCWKPNVPLGEIVMGFGRHHSIYDALGPATAPNVGNPYAWYIRMPDIPAFIRKIQPVLEERIAASSMVGHTGELKIDLYRSGLHLHFESGKLVGIESWRPATYENPNAGSPPLIFIQLLLGYRSLQELRDIFPDVWARPEATMMLEILFPKQPSILHPLA